MTREQHDMVAPGTLLGLSLGSASYVGTVLEVVNFYDAEDDDFFVVCWHRPEGDVLTEERRHDLLSVQSNVTLLFEEGEHG